MADVGAGFTPAFKFKQGMFLVFDRGRKARAYGHTATLVRQVFVALKKEYARLTIHSHLP